MSGFVVHGIPGSPYVRAAVLVLEEKREPYRFAAMPFGGHKQPAHLARHPFGRIPALEHDGWMLYESQAILRYVDAVVPEPALQPADPREAARMNQLMGITDWYFMPRISSHHLSEAGCATFRDTGRRGARRRGAAARARLHRRDRPAARRPQLAHR